MSRFSAAFEKTTFGQAIFLVLIAGTFVISAFLSVRTVNQLIDDNAQATARHWAEALLVEGPERIDSILSGKKIREKDRAFFETVARVGNVFRYKIFGPDGTLLLVSDNLDDTGTDSLQEHQPEIAAAIIRGETYTEVKDGTAKPDRPDVYAEAYVPYVKNGAVKGVLEVYVDQTATAMLFRGKLYYVMVLMSVLAVLGLGHTAYTAWLLRRQRRSDARIYRLAHFDTLTGVSNRTHFQAELERAMENCSNNGSMVALHAIDLDKFKAINDALGHDAGDTLLRIVAQHLTDCVRDGDIVARLGGDEFSVLQCDVRHTEEAESLAKRIVERIREITDLSGIPVDVSASVGTAMVSDHAIDAGELQKRADIALYHAKERGRDHAATFVTGMDEELRVRNLIRMRLRHAVETGDLELHYQPVHNTQQERLCAFEALARLPDGAGGYISPDIFIPLAEEAGLMPSLGKWVLHEACREAAAWPEHLGIAVNLSPSQFKEDVVQVIKAALVVSGLAASRLEIEITESVFIEDPEHIRDQLARIQEMGVRIVMDDFGTGYSSLSYLWRFPFDKLKVDQSCIQALGTNNVAEVLHTICAMSKAMNLRVTAEGVESVLQRDFVRDAGYDEIQGNFYSRPLPNTEVALYMLQDTVAAHKQGAHSVEALTNKKSA